ncbi:MAG: 30S ribosomal protein S2 [Candidatus Bathyarchaeota archaeon]|nr:30S ribosomal protein S2 [Candidatus Bathyarchaeota archaeon]
MAEDQSKENIPVEEEQPEEAQAEEEQVEQVEEVQEEVPVEVEEEIAEAEEETQEEEQIEVQPPTEELLLPRDTMLSAGIHIGTRMKTLDMEPFIYRIRPDGLFVLDVKKTDDRIRVAAKFLSRYEPAKVAVTATRLYAHEPIKKFCQLTGATPIIGRFIPGSLSNPQYPNRVDPEIIVVSDPRADAQAVKEASKVGIPIVALCSTDNEFSGVDFVIPTNNKGRRALAVIFWLLARQILRERGEIAPDKDPVASIEDFEAKITKEDDEEG